MARYATRTGWVVGVVVGVIVLTSGAASAAAPAASPPAAVAVPTPAAPAGTETPAPTPPAPAPTGPTLPPLPELCQPALPAGTPTPFPPNQPLSLAQAVSLAMYQQPQIGLSSSAAAAAAARVKQAVSGLYPSASLSANYTRSGSSGTTVTVPGGLPFSTGGSGTSASTTISAQQLLFDFGRTSGQVAQSRSLALSARAGLAQTRQDVVDQVKAAYYQLLANQRLVDVQRSNVADQQAHLNEAQARFQAGLAPQSDVIVAETAVASAIFNYVTAENNAAQARVTLNNAIGIDTRIPTTVQDTEEPNPPQSTDLVGQALAHRQDIVQFRANVRAAEEALRVARVTYLPDVYLSADYGLRGTTPPGDTRDWSYGVSLQWPFYNDGLKSGRIQEAQANLQSAQAQLKQVQLTVGSDVMQAYLNEQAAEQHVTSAAAEVRNAEESVRVATGRYEAGVAIYIEVIDAQASLLTARTDQVNALYSLSIARAALARALGEGEL